MNRNLTSMDKELKIRSLNLKFEKGYPTKETSDILFDELDFQRAVQLYLWSLPLIGFNVWKEGQKKYLGATTYDIVNYNQFDHKLNILTPNATTPYTIGFFDLKENGPMVFFYPENETASGFSDLWQRAIIDAGLTSLDKGKGGKYLLIGPDQNVEGDTEDFYVGHSRTYNIFFGIRMLTGETDKIANFFNNLKAIPYNDYLAGKEPIPFKYINAEKQWDCFQPRGLDFWKMLNDILNEEYHEEKDSFAYTMAHSLGLGIGHSFEPDERLAKILEEAVLVAEAMARAVDYEGRDDRRKVYNDVAWEAALRFNVEDQMDGNRVQVDERLTWFYEAVTASNAMQPTQAGQGSVYLTAPKDSDGEWLSGSHTYKLVVPKDVPAGQFWSVTAYDNDTRTFIDTPLKKADVSSKNSDIVFNTDGSCDIWFSPEKPVNVTTGNWIPTKKANGWFGYFRLYEPKDSFFDQTWKLNSIERTK